jgi:hypothetical protein
MSPNVDMSIFNAKHNPPPSSRDDIPMSPWRILARRGVNWCPGRQNRVKMAFLTSFLRVFGSIWDPVSSVRVPDSNATSAITVLCTRDPIPSLHGTRAQDYHFLAKNSQFG